MTSSGREYYEEDLAPLAKKIDALGEKAKLAVFSRMAERCRPLWIRQPDNSGTPGLFNAASLLDKYIESAAEYTTAPVALIAGSGFKKTLNSILEELEQHIDKRTGELHGSKQLVLDLCRIALVPSSVPTIEYIQRATDSLQQVAFWNGAAFPWGDRRRTNEDMENGAKCAVAVVDAIRTDISLFRSSEQNVLFRHVSLAPIRRLWRSDVWPNGPPNLWSFVVPTNTSNELGPSRLGIYNAAASLIGRDESAESHETRWPRIKRVVPRFYMSLNSSYDNHPIAYWFLAILIGLLAAAAGLLVTV